jgi:uncharacterized protein (DUF433 family)
MKRAKARINKRKSSTKNLAREIYGSEVYEYYPLGKYIVAAPDVCAGRPTFKYARLEVSFILSLLAAGKTIDQVVQAYSLSRLTPETIREAIGLADQALSRSVKRRRRAVA